MKKNDVQILIVDDDKAIGKTLAETITRAGFKSTICTRAEDALNQARLKVFHAAIIDCMLPVMNGISFAEELRKARFGSGVIILISGIFRDKSFESEALRKTSAIGFLQKPFGPNDLISLLKPAMDALVDNQQWTLQTILTRRMDSTRDRVKVCEHLEEIKGVEFAFVLSILADAKVSGFFNLVSEDGGIFGLKLGLGRLISVDSDSSDEAAVQYLIDTGYLTKEDWQEFEITEVRKTGPLTKLVQAGNISPHAAREAQNDQVLHDLKRILRSNKVNINFVPESGENVPSDGMDLSEIFLELNDTIDSLLTLEYLKAFFEEKMSSLVQKLSSFTQESPVWKYPIVKRAENIAAYVGEETTLEQLVSKYGNAAEVLKAVYCLVIFRQILFTDQRTIKNFEHELEHRQKILNEIKNKNPFQVFNYFGASLEGKPTEVQRLYMEFVKSNHPDRLSPEAPPVLRTVTTDLFAKVSEAYETLSNPDKLAEYQNRESAKAADNEIQSENLQRDGLDLIRRGSFAQAEAKIAMAMKLAPSNRILCLQIWARMKQTSKEVSIEDILGFKKQLERFSVEDRQDPHFHMAQGLIRAALREPNAIQSFEKALTMSPQFVEARREINATQGKGKESHPSTDILNGDITSIVANIFKRKSK